MAIVFALGSSMPFAIAGPDSKLVAVLAAIAAVIAADLTRRGHAADAPATVMFALIAGTLITGAGALPVRLVKAGRWIRFVPYPVIAGFMAASGGLLAAGGIRIVTGTREFARVARAAGVEGRRFIQLAAWAWRLRAACILLKRVKHPLAFPAAADRRNTRDARGFACRWILT